jgi:NADH:ubiquinone oxidoreductase subunit F (NADH-binding)
VRHLIDDIHGGVRQPHALSRDDACRSVMTPDDLDTPLDADSLGKKGAFIGSGVVT